MKQKVFIGCSTESLEVAKAIQIELDHEHFSTIWTQDIFKLTSTTLEDLITATAVHDFAIFIFSPDDVAVIREKSSQIVRDNVVFELGLFLGKLGSRKKVFIVKPRTITDLHLPTDLAGVYIGDYDNDRKDNLIASVGPFCSKVSSQIKELKNTGILSLEGEWSERWCAEGNDGNSIFFEDKDVQITQFGNRVSGTFKHSGRTYVLDGFIEQMRYVTGTWRDAERGPTYSGAFQFLININGQTLYGRWIGFSASSNSVRTGIWEWKRENIEKYPSELDHKRHLTKVST